MHWCLVVVASLAEDRGASSTDSAVLGHGLSCRGARGILLDEGWKWLSPALAGRFLASGPAGKSMPLSLHLKNYFLVFNGRIIAFHCGIGFCCPTSWITHQFSSVQPLSHVRLSATPWTAARQASLSITNSRSLLKLMSIESAMPSSHLTLCRPLLLLPSIFPSIRVFSNESALPIRWPKYWSFSFSISPNEHPRLISCRMDLLDLLAVQGTLKSLLQHHSLKASILQHWAFFIVQLSQPYMTSGKSIALTRWTFVGKVMSLLLICIHTSPLSWASLPPPSTPLGHHRALSREPHATEQLPTSCLLQTRSSVDVPPPPCCAHTSVSALLPCR